MKDTNSSACRHGEVLYEPCALIIRRAVRVYAPVGSHRDLLAYPVRRLLLAQFVLRIGRADRSVPVARF